MVTKTCEYLLSHLDESMTLNEISRAMNTNRNSLSKAFKAELNIGVSTWLRKKRMEKAKELLLNTDLSIQKISSLVGYPDQANFSTTFKTQFNQTPLRIRQGHDQ